MMDRQRSTLQAWTWFYAALFAGVVLVGHLPGVDDPEGRMFGLFHITLYQDLLHGASAVWAAIAAWHSWRQSRFYLRWFGMVYFLDGVLGAITGVTFLDLGIVTGKAPIEGVLVRILANLPHIAIGGLAMVLGFILARRWPPRSPPTE
ncbi:MAG TPA: hypothetical protein VM327_06720 [Candidatus Thermoplasmatota archaeon]|nr:hypothetical protein [Candidatus Thermoplasmatota archaeon]